MIGARRAAPVSGDKNLPVFFVSLGKRRDDLFKFSG
jgi:hypothetical protein